MSSIAFLGDSITFGYGLSDSRKRYSSLVAERLGMAEENYGICGTLIARAGLNSSDKNDFLSRISLIDGADIAVVFGGTNDYFWSDKPIFGNGDEFFECALGSICRHINEARKGRLTLFVTPYPHNGVGNYLGGEKWNSSSRHDTDAVNFNGHTLRDYVQTIKNVCSEHGIFCLDLHGDFEFDHREHTVDGCHPNELGHRLLADAIESRLELLINK